MTIRPPLVLFEYNTGGGLDLAEMSDAQLSALHFAACIATAAVAGPDSIKDFKSFKPQAEAFQNSFTTALGELCVAEPERTAQTATVFATSPNEPNRLLSVQLHGLIHGRLCDVDPAVLSEQDPAAPGAIWELFLRDKSGLVRERADSEVDTVLLSLDMAIHKGNQRLRPFADYIRLAVVAAQDELQTTPGPLRFVRPLSVEPTREGSGKEV